MQNQSITGYYQDIYLRDPQGNVMAVYRIRKDSLYLYEIPLYGSSRLGVIKENKLLKVKTAQNNIGVMSLPIPVNIAQSKNTTKPSVYTMGKKHYESSDWLGNVRVTYTDKKSWQQNKFALNVSSSLDYYPFGSVMEGRKYNLSAYRYAFNTQERVPELNESHYTALYWEYDGRLARRWNRDPVMKEHESVYAAFANNPVWFVDVLGNDTIDIEHDSESGKWNITNYQKVKGDDVFRLKIGDETKLYTFSEGEYGERVNALNLESNEDYTLGIYHISGSPEDKSGIGFNVTPGGEASIEKNSNKRLPEGEYDLIASPNIKTVKWEMPWVVSETNKKIASRGVKFHPAYSPSVTTWTKGCFVVFYDYYFENGKIKSTKESSVNAAFYFVHLLDAKIISDIKYGEYCRMTAVFTKKQLAKLIIKSTWEQQ